MLEEVCYTEKGNTVLFPHPIILLVIPNERHCRFVIVEHKEILYENNHSHYLHRSLSFALRAKLARTGKLATRMTSHHHIFSQGGDLSQLSGFTNELSQNVAPELSSGTNEEQNCPSPEGELSNMHGESMSSRAEAICKENRQINRFVEGSLKQLEKKRIMLINKGKALDEENAKLLEKQKRQSEQLLELQMNNEKWSNKYENELKQRNKIVEKIQQVESFISIFEQNFAKGIAAGKSVKESTEYLKEENERISKNSKIIQENIDKMKSAVVAELEKKAKNCEELKLSMVKDREIMVSEIQSLVFQNEEMTKKISEIKEEIKQAEAKKDSLTKTYDSIYSEHTMLNQNIAKIYQELNEVKSVNASRIQHLKLEINTKENTRRNLESKLKEKGNTMQILSTKLKELTNLSNQIKEAVDVKQKNIEKKVEEVNQFKNKKIALEEQANSLTETLKKYENVEVRNKCFKDNIALLSKDVKMNIEILTKKENTINDLGKELKELEEKFNLLKQNKLELEEKLSNLKVTETKLSLTVREDKISYQQERERKLLENESLKKKNEEMASKIARLTSQLEESKHCITISKEKESEIKELIETCKATVRINEQKFLREQEEQLILESSFNEKINEINNELEKLEFFVIEAKPIQNELAIMLEKKKVLEHEIQTLSKNHSNKVLALETNHRAKLQEMDKEMENHSSIMKNIQTAEEESTNKLKEEIKQEEKVKTKLENELRVLQQKLKSLKNEEMMKRNKIAKLEKRQQTIMKEIKVTREDIAQAVAGKEPQSKVSKRTRLMTPSSSAGSNQSLLGKVGKRTEDKENKPIMDGSASKQESTRKWIESVPVDEFEFSEI